MYHLQNYNSNNQVINQKIITYLIFALLINKKYIQFFYISNLYLFNNTSVFFFYFNKNFLMQLLLQIEDDQNYTLFFIQQFYLYNMQKKFKHRKHLSYLSVNNRLFRQNKLNNNFFIHNINIRNWYKIFDYCDFTWLIYNYLSLFFTNSGINLHYKTLLTIAKIRVKNHSYNLLNYFMIKQLFKTFINIIVNSLIYNHIPFFVCSKRLEDDVLSLYSFFLYLKTSILFRANSLKYITNLRKISKFKHNFGLPSFFFIIDLHKLLPSLTIVRNYNLPLSGFVTINMNLDQYDYPLLVSNWSINCIYLNYLIVLQLLFFGLKKKKQLFWHFFIKYQIIYILKKKILDLN